MTYFAEIDEDHIFDDQEVKGILEATIELTQNTLGTTETLDLLQSYYFDIAQQAADEDLESHHRIAIAGKTKPQVH